MNQILWTLPVPATALLRDAEFRMLPKRICALRCLYEDDDDRVISLELLFDGVEAFKCTYYLSVTRDMIETAYARVVDVGASEWLKAVRGHLLSQSVQCEELKHLMICFDDGPCYEFLCRTFRVGQREVNGSV